jgi:hypothetical protein
MGFLTAFNKKPACASQHAIERFANRIVAYATRLQTKGGTVEERCVTLIARSPSSAAARALALEAKALAREEVAVRLIFARIMPLEELAGLAEALGLVDAGKDRPDSVRAIKTPALLNAHEQLVLGQATCWTGDMLRRSEENRNGLDLWEENAAGSVRLAQFAFDAIWEIAKPVPPRILARGGRILPARPQLDPAVAAAGLAADGALARLTGSPVTRH